jgi:hypothetical protein
MLGSLGELFVKVSADTSELEKGMKKAESGITGLGAAFQKHGKAIGAAMTVVGVGLTALTDSSMKTNAALGTTALQLGISTKEMRALAIETANVTFPLSEVQASFDLLTRAGMTNADQIAASATAFDILGDAIGLPASEVTRSLIPAFNAFGIPLEEAAANTDMLTHLMRNTTVELSAFANMVNRLSPDLATMDMSMQEAVAVMEALADKGIQGTAATLEFRTAVSAADGDVNKFYEALGLTNEEIAIYAEDIESATGMTDEFANAQNKQFTTMDKIKHSVSEMTLKYGSLLQPLEALGPVMMGLGPVMMAMAMIQWSTLIPTLTAHAVAAWAAISPYLLIIAPILAVIGILAILEYKFGFVTKAIGLLSDAFGWIMGGLKSFLGITSDAADAAEDLALGVEEEARLMGTAEIAADALAEAQKRVADSAAEVDILTTAYEELQGAIADVLGLTEDVDDQARAVEHAMFGLEDAEKKYAEAVAEHGINSDEAARADLRRRDAVDRLDDAQKKQIKLTEELASADIKKQDILDDNNVKNLEGFENLLHNKRAQQEHFGDDVIRLETELVDAQEGLAKHRADMEIAEQKRIETEVISSWGRITGALSGLAGTAYDAGVGLVTALANGIISGISAAVDAVKEAAATIMDYFPFSDAKKGPLSNITASGAALMTTFAHGMDHSGIDITGTMEQVLPRPATISPASPAGAVTTTNDNSSSSSSVSMGDVNLSGDYNFEALMQDINRYQSQQRTQRGVR